VTVTEQTCICQRPDCRKPITDPREAAEKRFVVVSTGAVITLRRHDACAEKYASTLRPATDEDVRKFMSPASARSRGLEQRRRTKAARIASSQKRIV